jgi:DNA-binding beta-propeller fold protein YncE
MQHPGEARPWKAATAVCAAAAAVAAVATPWPQATAYEVVAILGDPQAERGCFGYLDDVAVDRRGNLYVTDRRAGRVAVFDASGRAAGAFGGSTHLREPTGIAVDGEGNVLVGDSALHAILKFAPGGELLWTARGEGAQPLGSVGLIDVDDRGNVYVPDPDHHRIQVFDRNGELVRRFGRHGTGPGEFREPRGTHVDAATDSVYVADYRNARVQRFDLDGRFLAAWAGPDGLDRPIAVAVHPRTGQVYVAEAGRGCVQVFDAEGTFVESFGRSGAAPGEFRNLHGIAIDARGRIALADTGNGRVQVLRDRRRGEPAAPSEER